MDLNVKQASPTTSREKAFSTVSSSELTLMKLKLHGAWQLRFLAYDGL